MYNAYRPNILFLKWNKVACEFNRWFKVGNRVLKQAWWSKPFDHQKVMRDKRFIVNPISLTNYGLMYMSSWFHFGSISSGFKYLGYHDLYIYNLTIVL